MEDKQNELNQMKGFQNNLKSFQKNLVYMHSNKQFIVRRDHKRKFPKDSR